MSAARPWTGRRVLLVATALFLVVLVPNILLAVIAVRTFSGEVVPDSYVAGQDFNRLRDAQLALGWRVAVAHDDGVLRLAITDAAGRVVRPAALAVTLGRPTTMRVDEDVPLEPTAEGYARAAPLASGNWRVEIAATAADRTAFRQSRDLWVSAAP